MTPQMTMRILSIIGGAHPSWTPKEHTGEVWHMALADLGDTEAIEAVTHLIAALKFPPTIAEIRARVISRRPHLPAQVPNVDPDNVGAYLQALRAQRTVNAPRAIGDAR